MRQTTVQENKTVEGGVLSPTPSSVPFMSLIQTAQHAVKLWTLLSTVTQLKKKELWIYCENGESQLEASEVSKSVSKLTPVAWLFVLQFSYSIV